MRLRQEWARISRVPPAANVAFLPAAWSHCCPQQQPSTNHPFSLSGMSPERKSQAGDECSGSALGTFPTQGAVIHPVLQSRTEPTFCTAKPGNQGICALSPCESLSTKAVYRHFFYLNLLLKGFLEHMLKRFIWVSLSSFLLSTIFSRSSGI